MLPPVFQLAYILVPCNRSFARDKEDSQNKLFCNHCKGPRLWISSMGWVASVVHAHEGLCTYGESISGWVMTGAN